MRQFKPQQQFAYDWMQSRPRCALALQQRLGKSGVAIRDIKRPTLIACPAFLKLQWLEEIQFWRSDLSPVVIYPDTKKPRGDVVIVNYEIMQECYLPSLPNLILDEAHYLTGFESKRTITSLALADRAETVRWLTGTMMPNRSMELWPFAAAMRATRLTPHEWGVRYAGAYQDRWEKWQYRGDTRTDELQKLIEPYTLRITRAQTGMPENEWKVIALDLPVDQRERSYSLDAITRNPNPIAWEGLSDLLHFQALAKVPQALAYVVSLLRQNEGPMLVFGWHRDVIAELAIGIRGAGFRVATVVGGMSEKHKLREVDEFQRGELDVIVANRRAAGVGLPLHMTERAVFVEAGWSPGENGQAADRGVSMERPRSLRVDLLVVNKSIDEFMVRRNLEKEGTIDRVIKPNEEFSTWLQNQRAHPPGLPATHPSRLLQRPFEQLRDRSARPLTCSTD